MADSDASHLTGLALEPSRRKPPPSREPPAGAAPALSPEASPAERLAARIEAQLQDLATAPLAPAAPPPELLAAYPSELQPQILEMHTRAFQAQIELRRQHLDLAREQAHIEVRRLELEQQRADREAKVAERRTDADARLRQQVAKSASEGIEARQRLGLNVSIAALVASAFIGVFGSAWVGGLVASGALVSWLVSQRASHRTDPALRALPGGGDALALPDLGDLT